MGCSKHNLTIYLDGVAIREDMGCEGTSHVYTSTTTLPSDVTYKWTIDGVYPLKPILSTSSSFTYTFDNSSHVIYLVATSSEAQCGIQLTLNVDGVECAPECVNACKVETIEVPAGNITHIKSNFKNTEVLPRGLSLQCAKTSSANDVFTAWMLSYLKGQPNCTNAPISVYWEFLGEKRNCLRITIHNSPIKFISMTIDGVDFNFVTKDC